MTETITEPDLLDAAPADCCEAIDQFLGIDMTCGKVPAVLYRRICLHEHIRDGLLCAEHVEHSQAGLCRTCYDLPGDLSHDCPIALAPVAGEPS